MSEKSYPAIIYATALVHDLSAGSWREGYPKPLQKGYSMYVRMDIAQAASDKARANGLTAGIALVVGLMNKYGLDARGVLNETGIKSKKELHEAGVEDFDLDNIGDLLPEE